MIPMNKKMILCGKIKTLMELSVMVSDSEKYHGKQYRLLAAKGRKLLKHGGYLNPQSFDCLLYTSDAADEL